MAKLPEPGAVKTRLTGPGGVDPAAAAAVAVAMLRCVVERLALRGPVTLALTPDGSTSRLDEIVPGLPADLEILEQGPGDLGARMERIWQSAVPDEPVAFLGIDSPDLPAGHLTAIAAALEAEPAAIGPSGDGGYWTLAGRRPVPGLLRRIDWGSDRVYDQTLGRAAGAGVRVARLDMWPDVDRPEDLRDLRRRLRGGLGPADGSIRDADGAALARLAEALAAACDPEIPS